jgi:hypothetical protein
MEVRTMRGRKIWFALFLSGLMLAVAIPHWAQSPATPSPVDEHARRNAAVGTLRAINTMEMVYKSRHGSFAGWDVLLASGEFTGRQMHLAVQDEPQLANVSPSKAPQILPGWALRLNVTADGQGYDVLLEDQTDKACHYAGGSDERAVIRQSKTIDCDI